MGDYLNQQGLSNSKDVWELEQHGRLQMGTSIISGASSVNNANFDNCTVIGQQFNIHSDASSPAQKKNVWFNMVEPVPSYTGREDKLGEVHSVFFPKIKEIKSTHQVAVVGLGGVGKSEFARKFAQKYYTQLDGNVVWINAGTSQLLIDSFKELATHVGIKSAELSGKAEIIKLVNQVYEYFGAKISLFIFDNVESWVEGDDAVRDYLPKGIAPNVSKPFVLMTSRKRPSGIKVFELPVLEADEAVKLVETRLEIAGRVYVDLLSELANLLGCLPLAIQQASSYIKQLIESDVSGKSQNELIIWSIKSYLEMFDTEANKLLDYKSNAMDVEFEELKTTLLTWRITLDKILGLNRNAIQLLSMMSYIAPDSIHLEMFEAHFTRDGLRDAVKTLTQFSMIAKNSINSNIVSVHRLVQCVVRLGPEEHGDSSPLEQMLKLLDLVLDDLPDNITSYTTSCVIHAQVAWSLALACPNKVKQFEGYPENLYKKGRLHEMHSTNLSLLEITLAKYSEYKNVEGSSEQYIRIQNLIAWALLDMHKYEDAKILLEATHKTAADQLGNLHPLTLQILHDLASAEGSLGNYSEQLNILEKVIPVYTACPDFGPNHVLTLYALHNKAVCLLNMGHYDEAIEVFKSSLKIKEKYHSERRESINKTRYWIALTSQRKGDHEDALLAFKTIYTERANRFGENHSDTLKCALRIAECLLQLGKSEEAIVLLNYNLTIAETNPSAGNVCTSVKYSIAQVLLQMRRYEEAVGKLRIVLDERISIYGETHPSVLMTRERLADALLKANETLEGLEHYKFVYENRGKILGADHPGMMRVKESMERILNPSSVICS